MAAKAQHMSVTKAKNLLCIKIEVWFIRLMYMLVISYKQDD